MLDFSESLKVAAVIDKILLGNTGTSFEFRLKDLHDKVEKFDQLKLQMQDEYRFYMLEEIALSFDSLNGFKDSVSLAVECRSKAALLMTEIERAESERLEREKAEAISKEAADRERIIRAQQIRKRNMRLLATVSAIVILVLLLKKPIQYSILKHYAGQYNYLEAYRLGQKLGNYRDTMQITKNIACAIAGIDPIEMATKSNAPWFIVTADGQIAFDKEVYKKTWGENTITVTIPPVYDGILITKIADAGFTKNSRLVSVEIPDTIETIGENAFSYCRQLEIIDLPANLKNIDNSAFYLCDAIEEMELPVSVNSIGNNAFGGWKNSQRVKYAGSVQQWAKVSIGSGNMILQSVSFS